MDNKTVYYQPLPPKPATLLIIEKDYDIKILTLNGSMRVGRDFYGATSEIRLHSGIVSRNHGEFIYEDSDGVYYYKDNNSLNGTYLNGRKLEKLNERGTRAVRLSDGDVLRVDCCHLDRPHPEAVVMLFSTTFNAEENWYRFPLEGKNNIPIGRNIVGGISLNDFMASRNHALLVQQYGKWKIVDNSSKNGLAVNKMQVQNEKELNPMDVIRIANSVLIFLGNEIIFNDVKPNINVVSNPIRSVIMNVNINEVKVRKFGSLSRKTLLRNVNLDIESGDFILILGGAGAGKSTFIKSLMGEIRADGQILLGGMDLYKNFKMLKHKIGIVPQFATTRENDTVYHTIMDAAKIKLSGEYSNSEIKQRVDNIIERMMLTKIKDSLISVISGGQRKRVEVAIQAIGDQEVFVLDEPDSGLDYAGRVDQMKNLKECTKTGCVVSVITHSPDDAASLFTKVIVLAKSAKDDTGYLAYYGDVANALSFFGVKKLSEIVFEINSEGGRGRADEFIEKFERTRRG